VGPFRGSAAEIRDHVAGEDDEARLGECRADKLAWFGRRRG
jgi:hypothetical protein